MNVTPLDLQVLFSKANDHSITQSKEAARIDSINVIANSQMTKESKEAPEVVRNIRENDEQFTKIDPDNASPQEQHHSKKRDGQPEETTPETEYKRAVIDDSMGRIIDIID